MEVKMSTVSVCMYVCSGGSHLLAPPNDVFTQTSRGATVEFDQRSVVLVQNGEGGQDLKGLDLMEMDLPSNGDQDESPQRSRSKSIRQEQSLLALANLCEWPKALIQQKWRQRRRHR